MFDFPQNKFQILKKLFICSKMFGVFRSSLQYSLSFKSLIVSTMSVILLLTKTQHSYHYSLIFCSFDIHLQNTGGLKWPNLYMNFIKFSKKNIDIPRAIPIEDYLSGIMKNSITSCNLPESRNKKAVKQLSNPKAFPLRSGQIWAPFSYLLKIRFKAPFSFISRR